MRRLLLSLLLAGCATAAPSPAPSAAANGQKCPEAPGQLGAPESRWFVLPPALQTRPEDLKVRPLPFDPPPPRVEKLPNGLEVYLLEDHTVPLVTFRALLEVGSLDEPNDKLGLADVTLAAMHEGGAGDRTAAQLDDALEFMAATLDETTLTEVSELTLNARLEDFDAALGILADVLLRPRFEQGRLDKLLEQAKESIRRREDTPGGTAARVLEKALYGPAHPLAREPSLKTVSGIKRDDLKAFHARTFVPANIRLLVTGDIAPDAVLAAVKAKFGGLKPAPKPQRVLPKPDRTLARQVLLVPRSIAQTKIRIGQLGFARHDPREDAYRLLDSVLGGGLGPSRLYSEIRDARGLAYSVGSMMNASEVRGEVMVAADTQPENTRELVRETLKIVEGLHGKAPVTDVELARARDTATNGFALRFDTAEKAAFERALHDLHGYPADYFQTWRPRIEKIDVKELNAAAQALLEPDALQIVVVGDPDRIGDLSEFGPVQLVTDVDAFTLTPVK